LTWGSVHGSYCSNILSMWVWPELFSLSLLRVSLVKTNEWDEAFFWPTAVSELCVAIYRGEWDWIKGGNPRPKIMFKIHLHKRNKDPTSGLSPRVLRHSGIRRRQMCEVFKKLWTKPAALTKIYKRCCDITMDSTTPAPWNGACTVRWISKQMEHIMLMINNCSRYKAGLLQNGCIILYFQIKTNSIVEIGCSHKKILGKLFSVLNR